MTSKESSVSRRAILGVGAGAAVAASSASGIPAAAAAPTRPPATQYRTRVALLGTAGGPPPMAGRSGICSALVVGDASYIVDLGHGAYRQLHESTVESTQIKGLFITHLHSDHIAELYSIPWLRHGGVDALQGPIAVYGPGRAGGLPEVRNGREVETINPDNPTPGTVDFIEGSIDASAYDLNIRMRDEAWPDIRTVLQPHDIVLPDVGASAEGNLFPDMDPFTVFEDDRVRVSATLVQHPPVFPSFAFRLDTDDGSVVFSGDTAPSSNLVRLGDGADVLVHEVIALDWVAGLDVPDSLIAHLAESHTDVDKVGALAEEAGVSTLVLNHLVPGDPTAVRDSEWRRRAQVGYSGKVVVARDLMEIGVGARG